MADLSKIKVGGTTYNLKDVDARADITELSSQIGNLQTAEGQTRGMISDTWTQKTYQPGEYAIYNNKLWRCKVANSSAPSEGANWTEVSVTDELNKKKVGFSDSVNTQSVTLNGTYTVQYDGMVGVYLNPSSPSGARGRLTRSSGIGLPITCECLTGEPAAVYAPVKKYEALTVALCSGASSIQIRTIPFLYT